MAGKGFDVSIFDQAQFKDRTSDVPVEDLRPFFPGLKKSEIPVWTVKGLTGVELGFCNEAAERNKKIGGILEGLVAGGKKETVAAVKDLIGNVDQVPADIAKRLALLVAGSVDPVVDEAQAVRFCKYYPIEFFQLTQEITKLTGQGAELGKPLASGKKKK